MKQQESSKILAFSCKCLRRQNAHDFANSCRAYLSPSSSTRQLPKQNKGTIWWCELCDESTTILSNWVGPKRRSPITTSFEHHQCQRLMIHLPYQVMIGLNRMLNLVNGIFTRKKTFYLSLRIWGAYRQMIIFKENFANSPF